MLTPLTRSPAQRARLADIRNNLIAHIAESEREGWLGEVEGFQGSLASAQDKLAQLDAEATLRSNAVSLRMPAFGQIDSADWRRKSPLQLLTRPRPVGQLIGPWPHSARRPTRRTLR